eukprot:2112475-Pyramimonas_sp.AAC.1
MENRSRGAALKESRRRISGKVPIPLPLRLVSRFFGPRWRPSSPPLDSPRNSGRTAPREVGGVAVL